MRWYRDWISSLIASTQGLFACVGTIVIGVVSSIHKFFSTKGLGSEEKKSMTVQNIQTFLETLEGLEFADVRSLFRHFRGGRLPWKREVRVLERIIARRNNSPSDIYNDILHTRRTIISGKTLLKYFEEFMSSLVSTEVHMIRIQPVCRCGNCKMAICTSVEGTETSQRPQVSAGDPVMQVVGAEEFVVMRQEPTNPIYQDRSSFSLVNVCGPWG